ncbi:MAG: hypothetical protein JO078_09505 [Candidatus Eremiobacteraeota bacterium]|nr:hypothetical protein [Candidatus Eremiobacteraeota bacterium]MBV9055940.1 hypothetical protein [Candidatus Eremiobacteraeota bacterium]MBV9700347.1 hypothetical protein [Candidatus Eremiobacteraeota bacterium]
MRRTFFLTLSLLAACSRNASLPEYPPSSDSRAFERAIRPNFSAQTIYSFQLKAKAKSAIFPSSTLSVDAVGSLYGATSATAGFRGGAGTIFKSSANRNATLLARFAGRDGAYPSAVVADTTGALYGTTHEGGDLQCLPTLGCGAVFALRPRGSSYVRKILYRFKGGSDGIDPGQLTMDAKGTLYGVTAEGGASSGCGGFGCGTVFRLSHERFGYRESILYRFHGRSDGSRPLGAVVFDSAGNLFGVTAQGGECDRAGSGCGTIFELAASGSNYVEKTLYRFGGVSDGDGAFPTSITPPTPAGTLYGTTMAGGDDRCAGGCGTVFKLLWSRDRPVESIVLRFDPAPGGAPRQPSSLLLVANALYGATVVGGEETSYFFPHGYGTIFTVDLATQSPRIVYDFRGPPDGAAPAGGLVAGLDGSLYGATSSGGTGECIDFTGCGTIYRFSAAPDLF